MGKTEVFTTTKNDITLQPITDISVDTAPLGQGISSGASAIAQGNSEVAKMITETANELSKELIKNQTLNQTQWQTTFIQVAKGIAGVGIIIFIINKVSIKQ